MAKRKSAVEGLEVTGPYKNVFGGRCVLVTGHSGFKGSWLSLLLTHLGAKVHGYALPPPTTPSNFELSRVRELLASSTVGDIRDAKALTVSLAAAQPDVIFHMAAQSLVRASYEQPRETFDVNVMGTICLLDAVRSLARPCVVVVVTSDKCYENRGHERRYRETDPMGGFDPYSASKGAAELAVASYRRSFFPPERVAMHGVKLASARAGNVIGGGDWSRDRIVVDIVKSLVGGKAVPVRNPRSIRPWQHVLEPLSGYLSLAASMLESDDRKWCDGWNFGPRVGEEHTVGELTEAFIRAWGKGSWRNVGHPDEPHESPILRLSINKAQRILRWSPKWNSAEALTRTARWYRHVLIEKADAREECMSDIAAYEDASARLKAGSMPSGDKRPCKRRVGRAMK